MAFRLATPGPGNCGSNWTLWGRGYSFPSGTDLIVVTLVLTLASSVPCDSGSSWTSPVSGDSDPKHGLTSPGDCGFHRYLTWTSCLWSQLGLTRTCIWYPPESHQDMVTLFTNSDAAGPINSRLHLVHTWTWRHWFPPGSHLDMMTHIPTCSSPVTCNSRSHMDIMWTWWLQCY